MGLWDWISDIGNKVKEGLSNIGSGISNAIDSAIDWIEEHTGWDLPEPNEERGYEPPKNKSGSPGAVPPSNLSSQGGTSTSGPNIPNMPPISSINLGGSRSGGSRGSGSPWGGYSGGSGRRKRSGGGGGGRSRPKVTVPEVSGTLISPEMAKAKVEPKKVILEYLKTGEVPSNILGEAISNYRLENVQDVNLVRSALQKQYIDQDKKYAELEMQINQYILQIKSAPDNAVIYLGGKRVSKQEALQYYQNKLQEIRKARSELEQQHQKIMKTLDNIETQLRLQGKTFTEEELEKHITETFQKDPLKAFLYSAVSWILAPPSETGKLFGYMLTGQTEKAKKQFVKNVGYAWSLAEKWKIKSGDKGVIGFTVEEIPKSTLGEVAIAMGTGYTLGAIGSTISAMSSTAGTLFNLGLGAIAVPQIVKDITEISEAKKQGKGELVGKIIEKGVEYTAFGIGLRAGAKEFTPKVSVEEKGLGLNVKGVKTKNALVVEYTQPEIVGIKVEHPLGKAKGIYSVKRTAVGEFLPEEGGMFGLFEIKTEILKAQREGNLITSRMLRNVENQLFKPERVGIRATPVGQDITQITILREKKGRFVPEDFFFTKEKELWRTEDLFIETPEGRMLKTKRGGIFGTSEGEIIPFKEKLLEIEKFGETQYGFKIEKPSGGRKSGLIEDLANYFEKLKSRESDITKDIVDLGNQVGEKIMKTGRKTEIPKVNIGFELSKVTQKQIQLPLQIQMFKLATKTKQEFKLSFSGFFKQLEKAFELQIFPQKMPVIPKITPSTLTKTRTKQDTDTTTIEDVFQGITDITTDTTKIAQQIINPKSAPPKFKITPPKFPILPFIGGGSGKEGTGWARKFWSKIKKLLGYQGLPDVIGAMKEKKKAGKVRWLPLKFALKYIDPIKALSLSEIAEIKRKKKKKSNKRRRKKR